MKAGREKIRIPFTDLTLTLSYEMFVVLALLLPVLATFLVLRFTNINPIHFAIMIGVILFLKDIKIEREKD